MYTTGRPAGALHAAGRASGSSCRSSGRSSGSSRSRARSTGTGRARAQRLVADERAGRRASLERRCAVGPRAWSYRRSSCSGSSPSSRSPRRGRHRGGDERDATAVRVAPRHALHALPGLVASSPAACCCSTGSRSGRRSRARSRRAGIAVRRSSRWLAFARPLHRARASARPAGRLEPPEPAEEEALSRAGERCSDDARPETRARLTSRASRGSRSPSSSGSLARSRSSRTSSRSVEPVSGSRAVRERSPSSSRSCSTRRSTTCAPSGSAPRDHRRVRTARARARRERPRRASRRRPRTSTSRACSATSRSTRGAVERLTALFARAKFSQHDVDTR